MVSQAPIAKLEDWRTRQGRDHRWVSSYDTAHHHDLGWTQHADDGTEVPHPGCSYYLPHAGKPYLTYTTRAPGTEAILPTAHIMDRTVYNIRYLRTKRERMGHQLLDGAPVAPAASLDLLRVNQ